MTQRWLKLLVGTLPEAARRERGPEMLDALRLSEPSGTAAVKESFALLWASTVAWRRYLASASGLRRSALVGALLWFGLLVGVGPVLRVRLISGEGTESLGWSIDRAPIVVAIAAFALALAALSRSRIAAAALGAVGLFAAGASSVVGQWQLAQAIWYEVRWIGLALVMVVWLAGKVSPRIRTLVVLPVLVATIVAVLPWPIWAWASARNYSFMLRNEIYNRLLGWSANPGWEWLFVSLVFVALALVVLMPSLGAIAAPATLHLLIIDWRTGLPMALCLAVPFALHYLREHATIEMRWRSEPR